MRKNSPAPFAIPPLGWLRAFETAARRGSFKDAAGELNVTPAAVSQQIKSLEEYYGVKLFARNIRSIELTRIGGLAAPLLTRALENIAEACEKIRADTQRQWLTITAPLSFSMKWLVPRLDQFAQLYPHIEVQVDATDDLCDINSGKADIGVRYGLGNYADLSVRKFISGDYCVVISPSLLGAGKMLRNIAQFHDFPLLHTDWRGSPDIVPNWEMWFKAAGYSYAGEGKGYKFSNELMTIDAAISGLGIALVSRANANEDIASGRLVTMLDDVEISQHNFHYYLVCRKSELDQENVSLLHSWLCSQTDGASEEK